MNKKLFALMLCALLMLSPTALGEADGPALSGTVAKGPLHLRARPDIKANSLGRYATGEPVELLAQSGDFLKVRTGDGREGYMMTKFLNTPDGLPPLKEHELPGAPVDLVALLQQTRAAALARGINPQQPMLALTFDDGPQPETLETLAALSNHGARATFFILGKNIAGHEDILRQVAEDGHELAVHAWHHSDFTKISQSAVGRQISRTQDKILELTGQQASLVRPPYGAINRLVRQPITGLGLPIILWNVDSLDWKTRSASSTASTLLQKAAPGAIVLMHDVWKSTAQALETALPKLMAQGYQLVTVSELMSFRAEALVAGREYSHLAADSMDPALMAQAADDTD
ncbi:MAG: polysaccharide deacetylase family protein [Clostridiales bacterium]|nr:polysaccharide deacetylase family protein [Clostridiales bacterium]